MFDNLPPYELSFLAPGRRPRTKPRITFTVQAHLFADLTDRLYLLAHYWKSLADEYCSPDTAFLPPVPDLFGHIEFGYAKCGLCDIADGQAHLHVELVGGKQLHCCLLTIKLLFQALAVPFEKAAPSNQIPPVLMLMNCDPDAKFYNHALGGWISSRLMRWLRTQTEKRGTGVPDTVIRAMRSTWVAVCSPESRDAAETCHGRIETGGEFLLHCNGADIGIYPDCFGTTGEDFSFSCHNLESAPQQATLLAGLAKLCELARENEA